MVVQRSAGGVLSKPEGITPMTVKGVPSSGMLRPLTFGSARNPEPTVHIHKYSREGERRAHDHHRQIPPTRHLRKSGPDPPAHLRSSNYPRQKADDRSD